MLRNTLFCFYHINLILPESRIHYDSIIEILYSQHPLIRTLKGPCKNMFELAIFE